MPYIPSVDRQKFDILIYDAIKSIKSDSMIETARLTGHFTLLLLKQSVGFMQTYDHTEFGSDTRAEQNIWPIAIEMANLVSKTTDIRQGELNYILSSIIWGLEGDCPGLPQAKYALRSYIKGALWFVLHRLENSENWFITTVVYGLLTDVIDETYRRKTSIYEDVKMNENGDLWNVKINEER